MDSNGVKERASSSLDEAVVEIPENIATIELDVEHDVGDGAGADNNNGAAGIGADDNKDQKTEELVATDEQKNPSPVNQIAIATEISNGEKPDRITIEKQDQSVKSRNDSQKNDEYSFDLGIPDDLVIDETGEEDEKSNEKDTNKPGTEEQNSKDQQKEVNSTEKDKYIWVSNINPKYTACQLKQELSKYGRVVMAKIVTNGEKYYGYARMEKVEVARTCIDRLHKKKLDGYVVELSTEPPQKKRASVDRNLFKRHEDRHYRNNKRRHDNHDPLTLKVDSKKVKTHESIRSSRRSSSERRRDREDADRRQKQRELEAHIERERRALALEKERLEREKERCAKLQKQLEDARRIQLEKEEVMRKREELKERERSLRIRRISPIKKIKSPPKSMKSPIRYYSQERNRLHKKSPSPPLVRSKIVPRRPDYKDISPKRKQGYNHNHRDLAPPPPPLITNNNDLRSKCDNWKKIDKKVDYYRGKDNFALHQPRKNEIRGYDNQYEMKHFGDGSYERRYSDFGNKEDKYKETKRMETSNYTIMSRASLDFRETTNRYDNGDYQQQPFHTTRNSYGPPANQDYIPLHQTNVHSPWTPQPFQSFQDSSKYQDYDKRNARYFAGTRKY